MVIRIKPDMRECNMKFTKASRKDKYLVTVSLPALKKEGVLILDGFEDYMAITDLFHGDEFILVIDDVRTLFRVNRAGKTATTKTFPRHLRLPSVGKSIAANVFDVAQYVGENTYV